MSNELQYVGRDLEAMSFAVNYHRWILQIFEPYLGKRIVEVGAGTGSFSELLLERRQQSLSLVEPSEDMSQKLRARMSLVNPPFRVHIHQGLFRQLSTHIRSSEQPDSIIYVNVLEHVPDDQAELCAVSDTLDKDGRIFIFVPALSWLLGSFDRQIGHLRRYSLGELQKKCRAAGFRILLSRYFDFPGVLPWWIKYRLLRSERMEPAAVRFYDKTIVPISRTLEAGFSPPLGKNIILVGQKAEQRPFNPSEGDCR
jgi:SAM-dependent methyltransferase